MEDGTVNVSSTAPTTIVIVTYDGNLNAAGAHTGTMDIYSANKNSRYNTTVSENPNVSVPVVSGGADKASRTKSGTYLDVKQGKTQSKIINDKNHNPIGYRLYDDVLIHQGNNDFDINTGNTASCTGVTGDKNKNASEYYKEVINGMRENNVVIVR